MRRFYWNDKARTPSGLFLVLIIPAVSGMVVWHLIIEAAIGG
ncbi:hypothetical protein [Thetidibacter halocola]|nr:hypothetical protein [Thetidibacter halocola]